MNIKISRLFLIIVILNTGCFQKPADNESDIYQALFNYLSLGATEEHNIVISEQLISEEIIFPKLDSYVESRLGYKTLPINLLHNIYPATSTELQKRFIEVLKDGGDINKQDIPNNTLLKPVFISTHEINTLFNGNLEKAWEKFWSKYPGSRSLLSFSRPAIDSKTDTAIIYASFDCGGTCGEGNLYLLVKLKGKWVVIYEHRMRVS